MFFFIDLFNIIHNSMSNTANTNETLTEGEAELYDRQIRLWGLEAQRRIRASSILLIGVSNQLAAECAKNLVLAGIHSLMLWDPKIVTCADVDSNFLLFKHHVGKKVLFPQFR